jgi:hypothetical protein
MKVSLFNICFLSFFLSVSIVFSQQTSRIIDEIFKDRGEVYFRMQNNCQIDIHKLTKIISIDHKTSADWIYAYANKKDFSEFLKLNLDYELLPYPASLTNPKMKEKIDPKEINDWDFYPTYEAYMDLLNQFEQNYPDMCKVFSIGTTVQGRQLMMAKLSFNVNVQENEPRFLYTSSIHGDELTGYILMLRLIDHLLNNYGSDDKVTDLLNNMEIWINPLANPDGTYAGGNESVCCATRFNANNIDLNRNYPDPQDGPHPDGNAWQKETIEFMELADSVSFVMAANFHGGSEVFNYPWDTWAQLHADDDWWQLVGREWADTVHTHAPNNYFIDEDNGITNGYAWYEIDGGRQDYMNYFHHCREVTLEISNIKLLPENLLPDYWEYNYRSFINYMMQGLYGIYGTITDSESGLPVKAKIYINDHDDEGSWVQSDSLTGGYFRPLMEGTYSITYSAPKYASQTISQISVVNYQQIVKDIELVYTGAGIEDSAYRNGFVVGPNPANKEFSIIYTGNDEVICSIEILDATGNIFSHYEMKFSPSDKILSIDTGSFSAGLYLVNVTTDKFYFTSKIIIR